jgi:hypothetical protein
MSRQWTLNEPPDLSRRFESRPKRTTRAARWFVRCLLAAWLLASMLFAHGCHGNEDTELFAAYVAWLSPY